MGTIIQGFAPTIGYDEVEPVRLRLMRQVALRLAEISVANGYHFDYASIDYDMADNAEPSTPPQIYFFDQDETLESVAYGRENKSLALTVEAFTQLDDATTRTAVNSLMLADVTRALWEHPLLHTIDPSFDGLADNLAYNSSEGVYSFGTPFWAGNISQWVILYHSVSGKPHVTQEEE